MTILKRELEKKSPLEKFEEIKSFVKRRRQFINDNNFEEMPPEAAAHKILYQVFDKEIRERLTPEKNTIVDKADEVIDVIELIKAEMRAGNINEAEAKEIVNSKEYRDYVNL